MRGKQVSGEPGPASGLWRLDFPYDSGEPQGVKEGEASSQVCIWSSRGWVPPAVGTPAECPVCPHPQFSLLSEVRGTISPQDLDRFDHLVLRREIESMKARQPPGPGAGDAYSMVSCSDTGSSTGSHGTSTTVSSARVSCPCSWLDGQRGWGVKIWLCSDMDLGVTVSATPYQVCPLPF